MMFHRNVVHRAFAPLGRRLVKTAAFVTVIIIFFIVAYIVLQGLVHLSPELFEPNYTSDNVSLLPALINTVLMTLLTLFAAVPVAVGAAIYLTEYADSNSRLVVAIRLAAETLAGIPSIIYGLFGMLCFVVTLRWGYSLAAGAATLAIMVLPLIMRTTEEALLAVPQAYREGSFALGAGQLRTIFVIILPAAANQIMAGIILAIGRIVGETAALIFTAGTVAKIPDTLFASTRTLAVHTYSLASEGLHLNQAYATAVVLLLVVIIINALSEYIANKISGGLNE